MRPLRHPLVLRALALVLLSGIGTAIVPAAAAHDARADALRSFLDDADAVDAALFAARATEGDAAEAFAEAYAEVAGHDVSVEAVRQLLRGHGVGLVAPVPPEVVFVPTSAAPAPSPSASAAVLSQARAAGARSLSAPPAPPAARGTEGGVEYAVQARGP